MDTPVHPCSIKLSRYSSGGEITDNHNGSTLAELKFKRTEALSVSTRSMTSVSKVPLLNDDKTDLNARAYFIFNQMFD